MSQHPEIKKMKSTIYERVRKTVEKAKDEKEKLSEYSFLWINNRREFLEYFLKEGKQLSGKGKKSGEVKINSSSKKELSLAEFKEQIDYFENLNSEVKKIAGTKILDSWFQVDVNPLKLTILTNIKQWSYLFKKHLLDHVTNSLEELDCFIEKADVVLITQLHPGDYNSLVRVMATLKDMKDRQKRTDQMFGPLEEVIAVLRNYGLVIPEKVCGWLETLPEKWANTKRSSVFARQGVSPLQGVERNKLKAKLETFGRTIKDFRTKFVQEPFFSFGCENPYELLSKAHLQISELEDSVRCISGESLLFDVQVPRFEVVQRCRTEIKQVKHLTDLCCLVNLSFEEWKATLWKNIDVENMDSETKKFAKHIKSLDKDMKDWDLFKRLETTIKNMLTCLRAIGELQNTAIRERHWQQLVAQTRVQFVMTEETRMADLVKLNLHKFEDEVHNLVDKSCKEMQMEKMISGLEATWADMRFQHETHARTGSTLLKASEDLIETLEENQVQLQGMINSKYIAFFYTEISGWQRVLCTVDTIITLWFEVQRRWSHLESIFVGSEDIRSVNTESSQRFQ